MSKYGVKHLNPEVLEIVNDSMKKKYTDIVTELIDISRSSQSQSYLSHKASQVMETTEIHFFNSLIQGKDKDNNVLKKM